MIVSVEAVEHRRCRYCGWYLGSGEFDLSREGRLQATCRICLVSNSLLDVRIELEENWWEADE